MKKYNIKDSCFSHAYSSSWWNKPTYFDWNRNLIGDDICFYTDVNLVEVSNDFRFNIGWLIEPPVIADNVAYSWIKNNYDLFDMILTYDKELLSISEKFKLCPIGGCWINVEEQKIYDKTKNISIIASSKASVTGHKLRHEVISALRDKNYMDLYGTGYNKIEYKISALKDYRFSVVIENSQLNYYFTEKLIDCFITGTIPIYWGCPKISKFFNIDGNNI